jgi:hypothetical protein
MTLLGLTWEYCKWSQGFGEVRLSCLTKRSPSSACGHPFFGSTFKRLAKRLDWIQAVTCQLSKDDSLDFCPDLVCPLPSSIYGYPFAEVPAVDFRLYNKFEPTAITQNPPLGSIVWRNTTTAVTVTATDKLSRNLTCTWEVSVPPLVSLGTVSFKVPAGSVNQSAPFFGFDEGNNVRSGLVFKMSGQTQSALKGKGTISARMRSGTRKSDKYVETQVLVLASGKHENDTTSGIRFKSEVPITFTFERKSDVSLEMSSNVTDGNNTVTFDVKGQITSTFRR